MKVILIIALLVCYSLCDIPTQSGRNAAVASHNSARSNAQPPPITPLQPLIYNNSLEVEADDWSLECSFEHSFKPGLGENIYAASGDTTGDITQLISAACSAWEGEESGYQLTSNSQSCSLPTCGHYTQMVWDDTSAVGCGYRFCTTGSPFDNFDTWTVVVCNYYLPGNVQGQLPYENNGAGTCDVATECANQNLICGNHNICGGTNSCGSCPTDTSCVSGTSCQSNPDPCDLCGDFTDCVNDVCICQQSFVLVNGNCVPDECANCGPNAQCSISSNGAGTCVCRPGFIFDYVSDQCIIANPQEPNVVAEHFTQTFPLGPSGFFLVDNNFMVLESSGIHILRWDRSANLYDSDETFIEFKVTATTGEFGIYLRQEQETGENDGILWVFDNFGSNVADIRICYVYRDYRTCSSRAAIRFVQGEIMQLAATNTKNVEIEPIPDVETLDGILNSRLRSEEVKDESEIVYTSISMGGSVIWNSDVPCEYFPSTGFIGFLLNPSPGSSSRISELSLTTPNTFDIELYQCLDDTQWQALYESITGRTDSAPAREVGVNANCS